MSCKDLEKVLKKIIFGLKLGRNNSKAGFNIKPFYKAMELEKAVWMH